MGRQTIIFACIMVALFLIICVLVALRQPVSGT
jgi:preprotein translocase subunit SecG